MISVIWDQFNMFILFYNTLYKVTQNLKILLKKKLI